MSRRVGFVPEAERELDDAVAWYDERSAGLGNEFAATIDRTISAINRSPRRGTPVEPSDVDLDIRRVATGRFPYQIVYLTTPDAMIVLAVAHEHRRPNYWTHRTPT